MFDNGRAYNTFPLHFRQPPFEALTLIYLELDARILCSNSKILSVNFLLYSGIQNHHCDADVYRLMLYDLKLVSDQ